MTIDNCPHGIDFLVIENWLGMTYKTMCSLLYGFIRPAISYISYLISYILYLEATP